MGDYSKELLERLRDGRETKLSPQARAVRKAKNKREREAQQAQALKENRKHRPYTPKPSKNDSTEWRNKEPKYAANRAAE